MFQDWTGRTSTLTKLDMPSMIETIGMMASGRYRLAWLCYDYLFLLLSICSYLSLVAER